MNQRDYLSYEFFKKIDESSNLAKFFNTVFSKLDIARMMHAPVSYDRIKTTEGVVENHKEYCASRFYELCLGELYLHSIINNLNRWQKLLEEYNGEFQSSWRYYAMSKRMDLIKEYGGEESDYNEDGSIKTIVNDDCLSGYSIIGDLVNDNCLDIFIETNPEDLYDFASYIVINENINIIDLFEKTFGKKLTSYRLRDGEMIENTFADEIINKIEKEDSACLTANTLLGVAVSVKSLINNIKKLDKKQDNKDFLSVFLPFEIQNILDLRITSLNIFKPL